MGNLWYSYTIFYCVLESLIAIGMIVLGIMFERAVVGYLFTHDQQLRFAHLFLSYACLTLIFPACISICLLINFSHLGFLMLGIAEIILGLLALVVGVIVILKPTMILQHGYIDQFIDSSELIIYIIGGVACGYGLWVLIHGISSLMKGRQINADFRTQQRKAKAAVDLAKRREKMLKKSEAAAASNQGTKPDAVDESVEQKKLPQPDGGHIDFQENAAAFANPASPSKTVSSKKKAGNRHQVADPELSEVHQEHVFDMEAPLSPHGMESAAFDDDRGDEELHVHVQ